MKLNATKDTPQTTYPTFLDYWTQHQKYLGSMAVSAGLALGSSMLTGCNQQQPQRLVGTMPPPTAQAQPAPQTNCTPELPGEPTAIKEPELRLRGDIADPQPPAKEPETALKGTVPPPTPPAK